MAKKLIYSDSTGTEVELSSSGGTGGGSEPSQYIKDASVSAGVLTLTKKDGTQVNYSASAVEQSFPVAGQTSVTITHTLGIMHPFIVCVEDDGDTTYPAIEYVDSTKFTLTFSTAFTGTVYIH